MLTSDFQEGKEMRITFKDTSPVNVFMFVSFVYNEVLPEQADHFELLRYSDMYDVPKLGKCYSDILTRNLSAPSAYDVVRTLRRYKRSIDVQSKFKEVVKRARSDPEILRALSKPLLLPRRC
jgi:hypothetical protein